MARCLYQTLTLSLTRRSQTPLSSSELLSFRSQTSHYYSSSHNLYNQHSGDASDPLIRKLEDAIRSIVARRSAPDWLPFMPGSSYWVPPFSNKVMGLPSLLAELTNPPLSAEESLSTTTVRGWPSSSYFIHGGSPHLPEIETTPNSPSQPEDEEG